MASKEAIARYRHKYDTSPKGRARQARYRLTAKSKARIKRYNASEARKACIQRYIASPCGKIMKALINRDPKRMLSKRLQRQEQRLGKRFSNI